MARGSGRSISDRYDRSSALTPVEKDMLTRYAGGIPLLSLWANDGFRRARSIGLVKPLNDALDYTGIITMLRKYVLLFFLREMAERKRAFWGWTTEEWIETIERRRRWSISTSSRVAYLLCGFSDLHRLSKNHIVYVVLARKVFGREYMKVVARPCAELTAEWGYLRTAYSNPRHAHHL